MSFQHQDWESVTFTKKAPPKKQIQIDPTFKKMKELEENNDIPKKIETVSEEDKNFIRTLRVQKKLTQDELTKKMSLSKDTIKDIELGKHPKNNLLVNKIKTFLTNYKCQTSVTDV
jgi:ribosome-binding protein aMBF1 (putative translation factor)